MPTHHHDALPTGSLLHTVYRIQRVLGSGAFGITYLAEHVNLGSQSVIKEYFPEFAIRQHGRVSPPSADRAETFNWGLSNFFNEAKLLHGLNHENIVKVTDLFEANGTAYFVMPYMGSNTLLDWIEQHPNPSFADLMNIFTPLLDGLAYIHQQGLLHRDIKPANILLTANHVPVLIDFGSARSALNNKPLTQLLTPNFAPIEQYGQKTDAYTAALDIYSLSACVYQAITRQLPEAAPDRIQQDRQIKLTDNAAYRQLYPSHLLTTIDKGLSVNAHERFQTASEMKHALLGNVATPTTTQINPKTTKIPPKTTQVTPNLNPNTPPQKPTEHVQKPQKTPKSSPKQAPKSSGSLKKIFKRLVGVGILSGIILGALPFVKTLLPNNKKITQSDKPYRDTVTLQINGKSVTYTGWLKNGIAEDDTGTATLKFPDGTQCTVGVSNNQRHGTGKCVYPKGSVYDGAWKNDAKHGYGKYVLPPNSPILSYEGGFVNGKLSGKGLMKYKNGAVFSGEFASDDIKNNGKGAITGTFGMDVRCEGTFTRTRANCQFKNGDSVMKYSGSHKHGLWEGEGELIMLDKGKETGRHKGVFRKGEFDENSQPNKKAPEPDTPEDNLIEEVPNIQIEMLNGTETNKSNNKTPKVSSEFENLF